MERLASGRTERRSQIRERAAAELDVADLAGVWVVSVSDAVAGRSPHPAAPASAPPITSAASPFTSLFAIPTSILALVLVMSYLLGIRE
jgi:hypothetical protein